MTTFNEREKGFEAKFKHDKEIEFKATARRNKLLGLWAAAQMGIEGDGAEAYAREVIESDFAEPGDADVVRKILKDFAEKGVELSEHRLRKEMDTLMAQARDQIIKEARPDAPETI